MHAIVNPIRSMHTVENVKTSSPEGEKHSILNLVENILKIQNATTAGSNKCLRRL